MAEKQATLSIAQLVFFNTKTKATNANRTETPLPVYIERSFKVQDWRNGGRVSETWVVCELSPCHVRGEEDGSIRDTTVHRRGGSFSAWISAVIIYRWRYRQYRSPSAFNNLCRMFSIALLYRCFTHVL